MERSISLLCPAPQEALLPSLPLGHRPSSKRIGRTALNALLFWSYLVWGLNQVPMLSFSLDQVPAVSMPEVISLTFME